MVKESESEEGVNFKRFNELIQEQTEKEKEISKLLPPI
jgi:hypothetical protein